MQVSASPPVKPVDHHSNPQAVHATLRGLDKPFPVLQLHAPVTYGRTTYLRLD